MLGTPTFGNTNSMPTPPATLAPGQYAVIVSDYAAFEERYNPTGLNNILVLGVYSGHLGNGGDTVDIYQIGNRDRRRRDARLNGYVPFYRVDHVNYNNTAPWPTEPRRQRPGLSPHSHGRLRQRRRQLGGEQRRRHARTANLVIDTSTPSVPTNLAGQAIAARPRRSASPGRLFRSAERRGLLRHLSQRHPVGTSTTTSFADTAVSARDRITATP